MVTSRQVGRGLMRTVRAIDREAKRAERRRQLVQKALHKQAMLHASAEAAAEYQAMIEALTGAHRGTVRRIDWLTPVTSDPLPVPERRDDSEQAAIARAEAYEPGWFARLFRLEGRERAALERAIDEARLADDANHSKRVAEVEEANSHRELAKRLVDRDPDAIVGVIETQSGLGDLPFSLEGLRLKFLDKRIVAMVDGLDLDDMPSESVTLLQSGKASVKAIAAGKRLELHREAICSAAIRVALEFLHALPLQEVEVVMTTDLLDRGSGHIEDAPVLYLRVTSQAVAALNLPRTEATALVDRLGGHYDWNRREGFRAIGLGAFDIPSGDGIEREREAMGRDDARSI